MYHSGGNDESMRRILKRVLSPWNGDTVLRDINVLVDNAVFAAHQRPLNLSDDRAVHQALARAARIGWFAPLSDDVVQTESSS